MTPTMTMTEFWPLLKDTPVLTGSGIITEIVTLIGIGETTAASASTGVDESVTNTNID